MASHVHYSEDPNPTSLPVSQTTTISPDVDLQLVRSISHDDRHGDLSRPSHAFTNEARGVSKKGLVKLVSSLQPLREGLPELFKDPEKAEALNDLYLVTWLENDPEDPRNWSASWRWYITSVVALAVISVAFASAVITGDFGGIREDLHVGEVVSALSVSLMVCGFGLGPLIISPLSELYGRRPLWIIPSFLYVIFNIPCAVAPNIQTLLICRFFCGLFASGPLTLAGSTISDIWDNNERGFAIALFAAAPYGGAALGPLVGGFIGDHLGWRWIIWINMMFAGVVFVLCATVPETFAPVLLKQRARKLRHKTDRKDIVTEQEIFRVSFSQMLADTLIRPFGMLMTEPILLLMSLFISLIYGLLYAFFFSFPVVFGEDYGYSNSITGLMFCSVFIGLSFALLITPYLEKTYLKTAKEKGGLAEPEDRLIGAMIGAPFVPIALFIFGWTSPPAVLPGGGNWVGPCSAGIPFGFGMVVIYFSANAYLIDAFPDYVASALAAKTVVRSGAGAAMPLFMVQMFHGLGNGWAASLLAFVSVAMIPIPFLFYRFGKQIRSKSKRATAI